MLKDARPIATKLHRRSAHALLMILRLFARTRRALGITHRICRYDGIGEPVSTTSL